MNKKTIRIAGWALGLSMAVAGIGAAVGTSFFNSKINELTEVKAEDASITFSDEYNSNTVLDDTAISIDTFTSITFNKRNGGTATQYYTTGSAVRWYGGGTLTFSSTKTLASVEISFSQTANSVTANVGTYNLAESVGNWSGSANSLTFTQSGTSGHCRITAISISYQAPAETFDVTFNANGGSGSMAGEDDQSGNYSLPSCGFTAPSGKVFSGWKANNAGDLLPVGSTYTLESDVEFFAQWVDAYTVTYSAAEPGSGSYAHVLQPAGTYTLLDFASLKGITYNNSLYRFKNYTVSGQNKNPGDTITLSSATTITVNFEDKPLDTTFDFSKISGFDGWSSSYLSHSVDYNGFGTVTFKSACRQTSTITNVPVTKGADTVDFVANGIVLKGATFTLTQWSTKTKTVELHYSTDGGETYTSTNVTSSNFTITDNYLPANTNAIRLSFDESSNQVGIASLSISYSVLPTLDSVSTEGQKTTFDYGESFSYDGNLTAHYTQGKADELVSPSAFKYGASDIDPTTEGTVITEGTVLTDDIYDGKYIYVAYTEDEITKWTAGYQISVEAAPANFIILDVSTDTGTNRLYKNGIVEVEVASSNLVGDIEWSVSGGSYENEIFDNDGFMANLTSEGSFTITAIDKGDNANTRSVTVTVYGSLNEVSAPSITKNTSSLVFAEKCNGSGTADDDANWTVTSDAEETNFDETLGIHYGSTSNSKVQYLQLSSSDVANGAGDKIRSVVVNATDTQSLGSTASLTVTVGGVNFKCSGETSVSLGGQSTYTFTGNASGEVIVRLERSEARYKAIYVKSVLVNYITEGAVSNIANASNMHLAQKSVIDFATDFNEDLEAICVAYGSTNSSDLTSAWNDLAEQFNSWYNLGGKTLNASEVEYAKMLFAYADSVAREDDPSADELQHMLAKYDWIVSHYNVTDFLSDDPGTCRGGALQTNPALNFTAQISMQKEGVIFLTAAVAVMGTVGGIALIRRRKNED